MTVSFFSSVVIKISRHYKSKNQKLTQHTVQLETVRVASPTRINLPGGTRSGWPAHIGLTWRNPVRVASPHRINLEEPISSGYPAPTGLICFSVTPSVCEWGLREGWSKRVFIRKRKRFLYLLQPTRSVGRFLQPTQSECIRFSVCQSVSEG